MPTEPDAYGFPTDCALIEVHVSDLKQLFNSFDPTPFQERDLDPQAEKFILAWAREAPKKVPLGLLVHVDQTAASDDAETMVHTAVRDHFERRADTMRQKLRELFRLGRRSLVIGLAFLAGCFALGDAIRIWLPDNRISGFVGESLLIAGWVALWKPIDIFLYEWWPIRVEKVLSARLSDMTVRVTPTRER